MKLFEITFTSKAIMLLMANNIAQVMEFLIVRSYCNTVESIVTKDAMDITK